MTDPVVAGRGTLRLPKLGLGTWPMKGSECTDAVLSALDLGYRHVDTAEAYGNEDAVGAALARTDVARDQVHVTTKVWWDHLAPEAMRDAMARSLDKLRTDHVNLYLIHWPGKDWAPEATMEALVRLREDGLARAIGVANFPSELLRRTVENWQVPVAALQVEYHVLLGQGRLLEYARAHDMALTAYTPLGRGVVAQEPAVRDIAAQRGVSASQVALAWLLRQDGVSAIPKAAGRANQQSNLNALNLRLSPEDVAALDALPKTRRMVSPDFAPAWDEAA